MHYMFKTILGLFARSPFAPLQSHMEDVANCVRLLPELFLALEKEDYTTVEQIAAKISALEHHADLTKNDIRNHLPKSVFLPIDRAQLLEILSLQDSIADAAEDVAVSTTLKPLVLLERFREDFHQFLDKNIESFNAAHLIIKEMSELLESSFGGTEANKVVTLVTEVAVKEHEADLLQHKLLKNLYLHEEEMSYGTFYLWQGILHSIASLSNLSEKLANRVRMTLELK